MCKFPLPCKVTCICQFWVLGCGYPWRAFILPTTVVLAKGPSFGIIAIPSLGSWREWKKRGSDFWPPGSYWSSIQGPACAGGCAIQWRIEDPSEFWRFWKGDSAWEMPPAHKARVTYSHWTLLEACPRTQHQTDQSSNSSSAFSQKLGCGWDGGVGWAGKGETNKTCASTWPHFISTEVELLPPFCRCGNNSSDREIRRLVWDHITTEGFLMRQDSQTGDAFTLSEAVGRVCLPHWLWLLDNFL